MSSPGPSDDISVMRLLAGRYRLVRLVGHGGMGSVYEAVHVHTEKRVAVKLLSPLLSKDKKHVARFRREALAASLLEHENCVRVDDFGEDVDGTFYLTMELIDGRGLADELRQTGPMPPSRVAHIAVQLIQGLEAAHAAGVLHRDLKPQNVMLTDKVNKPDLVKVVDFGIAKITTTTPDDQHALTVPGTIFGTPEYMSPEQARGEALDVRSDLYSAAVVLWHMMLGRSPFRGSSVRETLMKVFADEPALPSAELPNLIMPAGFEQALLKAMAKKREDRYPDAAGFLKALRPYVAPSMSAEVLAQPPASAAPQDAVSLPVTLADATRAIPQAELPPLAAPTSKPPPQRATERVLRPQKRKVAHKSPRWLRPSLAAITAVLSVASVVAVLTIARRPAPGAVPAETIVARVPITNIEHDDAKAKLDQELLERPVDPIARDAALARAELAVGNGDIAKARHGYEEATAADPSSPKALVGLATTAYQQKDWAASCAAFERAMALDVEYARKLAPIYARAKKFREAAHPDLAPPPGG
jgi:serine/threonine-protein kinase